MTRFLFSCILSFFVLSCSAQEISKASADKLMKDGNYKEAFNVYAKLLSGVEKDSNLKIQILRSAGSCLRSLGAQEELENFIGKVLGDNPADWRLMACAAEQYNTLPHQGTMIAGKFKRGSWEWPRYSAFERDRVRIINLMLDAEKLMLKDEKAPAAEKSAFYISFASLVNNRQPWKLQLLTDLNVVPDYVEEQYVNNSSYPAPVDISGNPLLFKIPASFDSSANDGERWRWMLNQSALIYPQSASATDFVFAEFLQRLYGRQTIGDNYPVPYASEDDGDDSEELESFPVLNAYAFEDLNDSEFIARLASGVRKFTLPDDYNYIKIYKKLVADKTSYAPYAMEKLVHIYIERRQLAEAASICRDFLANFKGRHERERISATLKQITGNWGQFESLGSLCAGAEPLVQFRFRNAQKAMMKLERIDMDAYLSAVKKYIRSNPAQLNWDKINVSDIGYSLVTKHQGDFIDEKVAEWEQVLKPDAKHLDSIASLKIPETKPGVYLLSAVLPDGNSSYIILYLADSVIVRKNLDNGSQFVYVADALSGAPVAEAELDFFGYRMKYLDPGLIDRLKGRQYDIICSEFEGETSKDGIFSTDLKDKDANNCNWLIVAKGPSGRLAFMGFEGIYRNSYRYEQMPAMDKTFFMSDRPVYRPGDTVKFDMWMQRPSYDGEKPSPFAGQPVTLEIRAPDGSVVAKQTYTADQFGSLSGEFKTAKDAKLGQYFVGFNKRHGGGSFRIEEYRKPEFEVKVESPAEPVKLGEIINIPVKASYYSGGALGGAKIKYKVTRKSVTDVFYPFYEWDWLYGNGSAWQGYDYVWYPGWRSWGCIAPFYRWYPSRYEPPELISEGESVLDANGTYKIVVDSSSALKLYPSASAHKYEVSVEVTDSSRRTIDGSGSIIASEKPFKVFCSVSRPYARSGDTLTVSSYSRTSDGKPVAGKAVFNLMKISYDQKRRPLEKSVQKWDAEISASGTTNLQIKAADAGQYRIVCSVTDAKGNKSEGAYVFTVVGESMNPADFRFNGLELLTDKNDYVPGESVKLVINAEKENSTVLLFVRSSGSAVPLPEIINLKGRTAFREIKIQQKDMPNFFIDAFTVADGKVHTAVREIKIPPEKRILNVEILPSKEKYAPGEKAKVKVKITDLENKPVDSSTVITVYDKSVEYISGGSNVPDIKKFFWDWLRYYSFGGSYDSQKKRFYNRIPEKAVPMQIWDIASSASFGRASRMNAGSDSMLMDEAVGSGMLLAANAAPAPAAAEAPLAKAKMAMKRESSDKDMEVAGLGAEEAKAVLDSVHVRKDFADTAYWSTTVKPDAEGCAEIEIPMPENLTAWKIKVWTMGIGCKVGEGEALVLTAKDFMIRLQIPRFLVETDTAVFSAVINNYLAEDLNVTSSMEIGGTSIVLADKDAMRKAQVKSNGDKRIDWNVKAVKEGEAVITVKAAGKNASDAMQLKIPVLVRGVMKTVPFCGNIGVSSDKPLVFNINVPEKIRKDTLAFELRYSPSLALSMMDALPYLVGYPYGCTEQTLNRFLPAVIVRKTLLNSGLKLEDFNARNVNLNAQEIGNDPERLAQWKRWKDSPVLNSEKLDEIIKAGIKRLGNMQLSEGGWGWFSGYGEYPSAHITAQVVHGLNLASKCGVKFDDKMLKDGVAWLKSYQYKEFKKLKNAESKTEPYKTTADNMDALVYMTLLESGVQVAEMGEFIYRDRTNLSLYGLSLVGLAFNISGDTEKRDMIIRNLGQYLKKDAENQTAYLDLGENRYWYCWYGNDIESDAFYLKLLAASGKDMTTASEMVKYLLNNRKNATYWGSTRDTAYCIEAFADYIAKSGEDKPDMELEILLDSKPVKTVKINTDNLFGYDNKLSLDASTLSAGKHSVEIRRKGRGPLYCNAYLSYFSQEDFLSKAGLEIKIERNIYRLIPETAAQAAVDRKGQILEQKREKFVREKITDKTILKSGEQIEVELIVESKNDYEYILLEDMKPAGFEPLDVRSGYNGNSLGAYMEFRDERVCMFASRIARGTHSISYRMRAETPGCFTALPAKASAMYAPELKANSDENRLRTED